MDQTEPHWFTPASRAPGRTIAYNSDCGLYKESATAGGCPDAQNRSLSSLTSMSSTRLLSCSRTYGEFLLPPILEIEHLDLIIKVFICLVLKKPAEYVSLTRRAMLSLRSITCLSGSTKMIRLADCPGFSHSVLSRDQ